MYIYIAINKINGKVYIGQTTKTVEQRKRKHFQEIRCEDHGKRKSSYFHNAIRKYGEDAFAFLQLDTADNIEELNKLEQFWIEAFRSTDRQYGYNLDSGGHNCKKHNSTKEKLRESTTRLHLEDSKYHTATVNGLKRGTETWKEICKSKRVKLLCPVCGNDFYLPPNEARRRTYCSQECSKVGNVKKSIENAKLATYKVHERKLQQNQKISKVIYEWALEHPDKIANCPMNKISTTLSGMRECVFERFGIKDWRTIGASVGHMYRKDFVNHLKEFLNENICCSSPN